jgi:hypothetical protein
MRIAFEHTPDADDGFLPEYPVLFRFPALPNKRSLMEYQDCGDTLTYLEMGKHSGELRLQIFRARNLAVQLVSLQHWR